MSEHEKPYAVLKPVLIIWLVIARNFIFQINATFVGGAFGGIAIFIHRIIQGNPVFSVEPFLYSALFFFIAVPITAVFIHARTYDMTRYVFYHDHLEYYEGFWQVDRKIVNYRSITEVDLQQTMVQRIYHLGTVRVLIPSLNGKNTGIAIADIKTPDKVYEFLQKAVRTEQRA